MTPQQKVMADLLQVSLFKWAEAVHNNIRILQDRGIDTQRLDDIQREVERHVDQALKDFQTEGCNMTGIEAINAQIVELKNLLNE